jgi:hypothetical protein
MFFIALHALRSVALVFGVMVGGICWMFTTFGVHSIYIYLIKGIKGPGFIQE